MTFVGGRTRLGQCLVAVAVGVGTVVGWMPAALAHTAFESSDPADGAQVDRSIEEITIVFTGAAEPAGDGFEVLTPAGVVVLPTVEVADDQRTFTLTLDEPLVGGIIGVRWSVRAGDAHPIEGSFSFTTTAPAPSPPAPAPTAVSQPAAAPDVQATPVPESTTASPTPISSVDETDVMSSGTARAPARAEASSPVPVDLDSFLSDAAGGSSSSAAGVVGYLARAVTIVAAMVAIGATALILLFARRTLEALVGHRWVALAAGAAIAGAGLEAVSFVVDGASGVLSGQPGVAIALRIVGGVAIATGSLRRLGLLQLAGAAAMLGSFVFDGHTVTEGNRLLTGAIDVIHAGAGAVWVAGVLILVVLTRSKPLRGLVPAFAARFSAIATMAIAAVGVAGVVLAVTIMDSFSELWSTDWGRTLIAKTVFVAGALAMGAYNHFALVPAVERAQADAIARFGRVVRIELALLLAVGALIAALVAGAT